MQTVRHGQMARIVELETGMTMTFGWTRRPELARDDGTELAGAVPEFAAADADGDARKRPR